MKLAILVEFGVFIDGQSGLPRSFRRYFLFIYPQCIVTSNLTSNSPFESYLSETSRLTSLLYGRAKASDDPTASDDTSNSSLSTGRHF